ncbi:MAG: CehA/McbA family metallohydrolase [Anaerolineaceae bacterium]|nr:CehA/McbA family metallohydrolase [Anaerolineaceae bacterium]
MTETIHYQFEQSDTRQIYRSTMNVPEGTTSLTIEIVFDGRIKGDQKYPNQINFSLFDPQGNFRGTRSCDNHTVWVVAKDHAKEGFIPGPVTAGEWLVVVSVHRILSDVPVDFSVTITPDDTPIEGMPRVYAPGTPAKRGAGWYRGDIHAHTNHSDGHCTVAEFIAFGKKIGLDFLTLSDHNTISGLPEFHSYADDELVTLGAMELSTPIGHGVALGIDRWFDYSLKEDAPFSKHVNELLATGAFFTIAHPKNEGEPMCGGCRWLHKDLMPGVSPGVEIWNGLWQFHENNCEEALQLYYGWLNEGFKLVATSGTDAHGVPVVKENPTSEADVSWAGGEAVEQIPSGFRLRGAGFNVVWAEEFSREAIFAGIKQGHSYISEGPGLEFKARTASGADGMLGDVLPNEDAVISLGWQGCEDGDRVDLVINGKVVESLMADPQGAREWVLAAKEGRWWVTVEIRAADGLLRAVANPIFFDGK